MKTLQRSIANFSNFLTCNQFIFACAYSQVAVTSCQWGGVQIHQKFGRCSSKN